MSNSTSTTLLLNGELLSLIHLSPVHIPCAATLPTIFELKEELLLALVNAESALGMEPLAGQFTDLEEELVDLGRQLKDAVPERLKEEEMEERLAGVAIEVSRAVQLLGPAHDIQRTLLRGLADVLTATSSWNESDAPGSVALIIPFEGREGKLREMLIEQLSRIVSDLIPVLRAIQERETEGYELQDGDCFVPIDGTSIAGSIRAWPCEPVKVK